MADHKPCPFCGGGELASSLLCEDTGEVDGIWCKGCGAEAPADVWNDRALRAEKSRDSAQAGAEWLAERLDKAHADIDDRNAMICEMAKALRIQIRFASAGFHCDEHNATTNAARKALEKVLPFVLPANAHANRAASAEPVQRVVSSAQNGGKE